MASPATGVQLPIYWTSLKPSRVVLMKDNMDVLYLHFSKAFDKVPHARLLEKMKAHGIGLDPKMALKPVSSAQSSFAEPLNGHRFSVVCRRGIGVHAFECTWEAHLLDMRGVSKRRMFCRRMHTNYMTSGVTYYL